MGLLLKHGVRLDDLTPEEVASVSLDEVTALRAEWFPRAAAAIDDGPQILVDDTPAGSCGAALHAWALRMSARDGALVVTHRTPLDHLSALAVVRYGEDPRQWPGEWSPGDVARALKWESGEDVPGAVSGRAIVSATGLSVVAATLTTEG